MSFTQGKRLGLLVRNLKKLNEILKMASANTRMAVAAQFTAAGEEVDEAAFQDMDRELKKEAG